jgi:sec-independent protein translocase protein TatA
MFANLTGWHALIILAVVLLLFGAAKLPALARSVGQSVKILQKEVQTKDSNDTAAQPGVVATADVATSGDTRAS